MDLEYEVHADDPMPGVISSFAYMRGVLEGMWLQPARVNGSADVRRTCAMLTVPGVPREAMVIPARVMFHSGQSRRGA